MSLQLILNNSFHNVEYSGFYKPLLLIDVRKNLVRCDLNNTIFFYVENPRTNIELISGYFEFYFHTSPQDFMLGQVISKSMISYRTTSSITSILQNHHEYLPCILFTKGFYIQEILIYMPIQNLPFLRELKYYWYARFTERCCVCLDEKDNIINVHQNAYHHLVCFNCLLRIEPICPICRADIL